MVALIGDQIHQFLVEKEETRCAALEAEYNKNNATKRKPVKRRTIQKPWVRPSENTLCQDIDLLIMVDEYDYDLGNKDFQAYCQTRGVFHVTGNLGSKKWEYMADYTKTKTDYLADPAFHFAQEFEGKRYQYTKEEIETAWTIILLGRAKLEDCWELFSRYESYQK